MRQTIKKWRNEMILDDIVEYEWMLVWESYYLIITGIAFAICCSFLKLLFFLQIILGEMYVWKYDMQQSVHGLFAT